MVQSSMSMDLLSGCNLGLDIRTLYNVVKFNVYFEGKKRAKK